MAVSKNRMRLELQNNPFVLEVDIIVMTLDDDGASDFPVSGNLDLHFRLSYPLLHRIDIGERMPNRRRRSLNRSGILNYGSHRFAV